MERPHRQDQINLPLIEYLVHNGYVAVYSDLERNGAQWAELTHSRTPPPPIPPSALPTLTARQRTERAISSRVGERQRASDQELSRAA